MRTKKNAVFREELKLGCQQHCMLACMESSMFFLRQVVAKETISNTLKRWEQLGQQREETLRNAFLGWIFIFLRESFKTMSAEGPPSRCLSLCSACHWNAKAAATCRGPGGANDTRGGKKIKGGKLRRKVRASAEDRHDI